MRYGVILVLLVGALSGCSTKTLTSDDIGKYSSLGLGELIKERFYMHRSAIARSGENQNFTIKPMDTLKYSGYYNYPVFGEVGDLLMRPKRELALYCENNGGEFNQLYAYTENIVQIAVTRKYNANKRVLEVLKSESGDLWHHPDYFKTVKLLEDTLKLHQFIYSAPRNRKFVNDAIEGYRRGVKDKPMGLFNCTDTSGKEKWSVSILPQRAIPADPANSLTAHEVVMGITANW